MTTPNQFNPLEAANFDSLATWAAKTQEDWEAEQRNPELARWGGIRDGFWLGLPTGQPYTLTLLSYMAIQLLGLDPTTFFEGVQDAIDAIRDWLNDIQEQADQASLDLAEMIDGVLGSGNQVEDLVQFLIDSRDQQHDMIGEFFEAVFGTPTSNPTITDWATASAALTAIAETAQTNAQNATLQFATLVDSVLGTGHGAQDLAQYIIDAQNRANQAWDNFIDLVDDLLAAIGLSQTGDPNDIPEAFEALMNSIFGQPTRPSGKPPLAGQIDGAIGQVQGSDDDASSTADEIAGALGGSIPSPPWGILPIASSTTAAGVPEGFLYCRVTAVNGTGESVASGEAFILISPAWLFGKAKVTWTCSPITGATAYRWYVGSQSRAQTKYVQTSSYVFVQDGTETWTNGTPPSAPVRAGTAVASIAATASVAETNADLAQTAAGVADGKAVAAQVAADDAASSAQLANNGVSTVSSQTGQISNNLVGINASIDDLYDKIDIATATPSFDSAGTGNGQAVLDGTANKELNLAWTHNATSTATMVLVFATFQCGTGNYSWSATYGGVAMTVVGNSWAAAGTNNYTGTVVFCLHSPPSGSKTVTVKINATDAGGSNAVQMAVANSVAYRDAATVSALMNVSTTSSALSQPIQSADRRVVVQDFTVSVMTAPVCTISGYSQTTRATANISGTYVNFATWSMRKLIGEALGEASVINFSATTNAGATFRVFSGVAVELSAR